ncbi:MAG: hypothetical protein WCG29_06760 [Desulfomonile sp.]
MGQNMGIVARMIIVSGALLLSSGSFFPVFAEQVWTKCHITCRCLNDNSVGNFAFDIPVDRSPDIGFEADLTCKSYGHRVCYDGCNGLKFSYTYQVTSP